MQTHNWGDLAERAKNASGGAGEPPVPSQDYPIVISHAESKPTQKGKPMIKVRGKIQGGPYDGRTIFNQYVLSEENDNAVAIFMKHMAAFGLTQEWFTTNNPSFEQIAAVLVGRSAIWEVGQKIYNNENRNEVKNTKPATGGVPAPTPQASPSVPQIPETVGAAAQTPPLAQPAPAPGFHVPAPPAPVPAAPPVATPPAPPAPADAGTVPPAPTPAPPAPPF